MNQAYIFHVARLRSEASSYAKATADKVGVGYHAIARKARRRIDYPRNFDTLETIIGLIRLRPMHKVSPGTARLRRTGRIII